MHDNSLFSGFHYWIQDTLFSTPESINEGLGWKGEQMNSVLDRLIWSLRYSIEKNIYEKFGEVS